MWVYVRPILDFFFLKKQYKTLKSLEIRHIIGEVMHEWQLEHTSLHICSIYMLCLGIRTIGNVCIVIKVHLQLVVSNETMRYRLMELLVFLSGWISFQKVACDLSLQGEPNAWRVMHSASSCWNNFAAVRNRLHRIRVAIIPLLNLIQFKLSLFYTTLFQSTPSLLPSLQNFKSFMKLKPNRLLNNSWGDKSFC